MIGSERGVAFLAAVQADLLQGTWKDKVWNQSFHQPFSHSVLNPGYLAGSTFIFSPFAPSHSPFPSVRIVETDGQSVHESLAELQKCWRGAKPSNCVVTPLSVSPWCTLSHIHTSTFMQHTLTGACLRWYLQHKKKKTCHTYTVMY